MDSPWYFNRYLHLAFSLSICILSYFLSTCAASFSEHENLFPASGALITVSGLFLNIKHTLLFHTDDPLEVKHAKAFGSAMAGGGFGEDQKKEINEILTDEKFGIVFMLLGTIIWAYGNFLV